MLSLSLSDVFSFQMERKERKSPSSDTLYEVVSLESETEREKRKTTASPSILPSGPGTMAPSPPEDDEEEGNQPSFCYSQLKTRGSYKLVYTWTLETVQTPEIINSGAVEPLEINKTYITQFKWVI